MKQTRLMNVLLSPVLSEKSHKMMAESNQVVFKVAKDATKTEIKAAVELLFETKVLKVTTLNVKGKTVLRRGKIAGRRANWKKAYVTMEDVRELDFMTAM